MVLKQIKKTSKTKISSGDLFWSLSMSWHNLLVRSAFNQSSIFNLFTRLLFPSKPPADVPSGTKTKEQSNQTCCLQRFQKQARNCQTFWKLANPSFSLCQTGAWGSRGLDGAIGNLFHRGIMCIESTVLHNSCTIRLYIGNLSSYRSCTEK